MTPTSFRFSAPNSREALARVRAELGADAMVISSRRTDAGFEIVAMAPESIARIASGGVDLDPSHSPLLAELRALAARVDAQLGRLQWDEEARRRPLRTDLAAVLVRAGFSEALARQLLARLPDDYGEPESRRWLQASLSRLLACVPEAQDIVATGGVHALVGPTGVGKTTTVAKLAARCVVRYGAASLGLVTTDSYRVGAHEQLRIYGKILGVPVHPVCDAAELGRALDALAGRRLVLVDTVGIGQRDTRVAEQLALLASRDVGRILVAAASAQAEAIDESVAAYLPAAASVSPKQAAGRPHEVILTKVDEAVKLGGALDVLIRRRLRVQAVANGQRVPEDLHAPHAAWMVDRALRRSTTAAESAARPTDVDQSAARPTGVDESPSRASAVEAAHA